MRRQGCNANGEVYGSAFVEHESVDAPHADDGRTRQEFKDECDINIILERYEKVGVINHWNDGTPQYLDVSEMPTDLQGALLYVEMARESFMRLPAIIRRDFDNDPVRFAEFAGDSKNIEKMREWGLAAPAEVAGASEPPAKAGEASAPSGSPAAS